MGGGAGIASSAVPLLASRFCSPPTSMLDAPPLAGGTTTTNGRGRRLLHRRGNAARRAIRRRLVAITGTERRLHLRNTATRDDEPITHAHTRMWTRNECARATNVHAHGYAHRACAPRKSKSKASLDPRVGQRRKGADARGSLLLFLHSFRAKI